MNAAEASAHRVAPNELWCALLIATAWVLLLRPGSFSLPYFWDEADVYAQGARWLALHDLDPTPGHFPDDWSRGHPPLLYWIGGVAFRLFGAAPLVAHAVIIPCTIVALVATYVLGRELSGSRWVGCGGALLLGCSPLFMTMGVFFLPEMPLTAFTAVALVCAQRKHYLAAALCGVVLVWIKETGLATPLAISSALLATALHTKQYREARKPIAISLSPVLALALFFVWQRIAAGYFVFPHHQNLFAERSFNALSAFTIFPSLLLWHGRWVATLAACLGCSAFLLRKETSALLHPATAALAIIFLVLGNAIFFAKMFWLERYALPAHPGVCVLLSWAIVAGAVRMAPRVRQLGMLPIAATTVIGLISLYADGTTPVPEHTFAFADIIRDHQAAYQRISRDGEQVILTTWPLTTELREPWLGYVDQPMRSAHPDNLSSRDELPTAVLVDATSHRAEELRRYAREHGMSQRWRVRTLEYYRAD